MKTRIFNGVRAEYQEVKVDLLKIILNKDNPRTKEEQEENGKRMESVFKNRLYDDRFPVVLIPDGDNGFVGICGNGRIDGAQRLEESDPERFVEVFGKQGRISAYVLPTVSEEDIVRIMADHSGIDPMPLSKWGIYLSVRHTRSVLGDSEATRAAINESLGKSASGSYCQEYLYIHNLETDHPATFAVFEANMKDAKLSRLLTSHSKTLHKIWSVVGFDSSKFVEALENLQLYGKITVPETSAEKETAKQKQDILEANAAFLLSVLEFSPESETMKVTIDALASRNIDRLLEIDAGCVSMEQVIDGLQTQELAVDAVV